LRGALFHKNINPKFISNRTKDMKIHKTTDTAPFGLQSRILKLIRVIDGNPMLLYGALFYVMLVLGFASKNL